MNFYERMSQRPVEEKDRRRAWYFFKTKDYILCNRFCTVLIQETGDEVEMEPELFDAFKRTLWNEAKSLRKYYDRVFSYDAECDDNGTEYLDLFSSKDSVEDDVLFKMTVEQIKKTIKDLPPIQQEVMNDLYCEHMTITDTAKKIGIAKQTVSYHKQKATNAILECLGERE